MVRLKQFHSFFPSFNTVEYAAEVPPGYALRATASDGEGHTHTPSGSSEYHSTWFQPTRSSASPVRIQREREERQSQQAAFEAHLQSLQDQGPLEVILGEPRLLFSITNSPGEVIHGSLELVGPNSDATR